MVGSPFKFHPLKCQFIGPRPCTAGGRTGTQHEWFHFYSLDRAEISTARVLEKAPAGPRISEVTCRGLHRPDLATLQHGAAPTLALKHGRPHIGINQQNQTLSRGRQPAASTAELQSPANQAISWSQDWQCHRVPTSAALQSGHGLQRHLKEKNNNECRPEAYSALPTVPF